MMFDATFNTISVIWWRSVLLVSLLLTRFNFLFCLVSFFILCLVTNGPMYCMCLWIYPFSIVTSVISDIYVVIQIIYQTVKYQRKHTYILTSTQIVRIWIVCIYLFLTSCTMYIYILLNLSQIVSMWQMYIISVLLSNLRRITSIIPFTNLKVKRFNQAHLSLRHKLY